MNLTKAIFEHLKTKRKYNTLELKYRVKCEELEDKVDECKLKDRIYAKRQELWEKTIKEQEEEIIKLKKRKKNENSTGKRKGKSKD